MTRFSVALAAATAGFAAAAAPPTAMIIGGEEAEQGEFPATVSISYQGAHMCGGVLLDSTTVLTAAHCSFNPNTGSVFGPGALSVTAGTNNIGGSEGTTVEVEKVSPHDGFVNDPSVTPEHDVSILKLSEPIESSQSVQYAQVASSDPAAGSTGTVAGWGLTEPNGNQTPDTLMKIDLDLVSRPDCVEAYDSATGGGVEITEQHICYGAILDEGTCNGDSGGPIYSGNGTVVGIVSFGLQRCAMDGIPSVFADVAANEAWILENSF